MNPRLLFRLGVLALIFGTGASAQAGIAGTTAREVADAIIKKFGKGAAGETIEQVADATIRTAAKYGDECVPLLRSSGHAGFRALEEAGEKAPDVIRLFAKRGDEAVWIISEPKKLAIFIKHGDTAANALLKHPGIADTLIESAGPEAAGALVNLSRQSAQRLSIAAADGMLSRPQQGTQLLTVLAQYGDAAMDFVWRNKGPLAATAVMASFLADPKPYIDGVKELVVDPIAAPLVKSVNWTLIAVLVLAVFSAPWLIRSLTAGRRISRE
jgi:hypothetical protein